MIGGWDIFCKIALRWKSLDLINDKSTLVQVMAWCRQATIHYLSQCWPRSMSPYGVTRPQWVNISTSTLSSPTCIIHLLMASSGAINSLRPSDAIWRHRSGSTLAQVMACCLTAPSHYLNQCWLTISEDIHQRASSLEIPQLSVTEISLKITYLKYH